MGSGEQTFTAMPATLEHLHRLSNTNCLTSSAFVIVSLLCNLLPNSRVIPILVSKTNELSRSLEVVKQEKMDLQQKTQTRVPRTKRGERIRAEMKRERNQKKWNSMMMETGFQMGNKRRREVEVKLWISEKRSQAFD